MMIIETLYGPNGEPLGKIREDILNAEVTFIPAVGSQRLDMKAAIQPIRKFSMEKTIHPVPKRDTVKKPPTSKW
jgi:hypothetical protein